MYFPSLIWFENQYILRNSKFVFENVSSCGDIRKTNYTTMSNLSELEYFQSYSGWNKNTKILHLIGEIGF